MIPEVINIYLQDATYEEFGVEEEDQMNILKDTCNNNIILLIILISLKIQALIIKNLELKNILIELQKSLNELLDKLGLLSSRS